MVIEAKGVNGSASGIRYQQSDKELGDSEEISRSEFLIGDDPKELHAQMKAVENQYSRANFEKARLEIVISPTEEQAKTLKTKEDWDKLVHEAMQKADINAKEHLFLAHLHRSTGKPHLHLKVSRINLKGQNKIPIRNVGRKFGEVSNKISKERGWQTAKEHGTEKRREVSEATRQSLKTSKNFSEFSKAMDEKGYLVKYSENQAKGIYGARILDKSEIYENPSKKQAQVKQGFKLSELETGEGKEKFSIEKLKFNFMANEIKNLQEQKQKEKPQEKNQYSEIFEKKQEQKQNQGQNQQQPEKEKTQEKNEFSQFEKLRENREKQQEQNQEQERRRGRGR